MISIKTLEEIRVMRLGGKILAEAMDLLGDMAIPGAKSEDFEKTAEKIVKESGGKCSFKGQDGFPSCLCFSVNEEIVHGTPVGKILKEGDIVSLDFGIFFPLSVFIKEIDQKKYPNLKNGFHTDMARTYLVGEVDPETQRLVRATKKSLKRGIKKVKPGITFGDIGETIQRYADSQSFGIIRDLCGHGIGKDLHEDPEILNYGKRHTGEKLKEGMVFCLEPMLTNGSIKIKKRGSAFVTEDGSLSAHFEDMMAVTRDGVIVLTEK
ncbi:MAG: type I methionyl aminopeptidase [Candidatus Paceibacterota bacterium]|jgi:methionyl aminopeptidase